jgi:calcineurin-like phosphoesterase family protein
MRRYFTADLHLGSARVLELCKRPFLDNIEMTDKLIQNCNEIAREKDDVLYHIGDLYCLKDDNGSPGMLLPWRETQKRFTAKVINIEGNHDPTNGVKSMATSMRMTIGKVFNVVLCHYPSTDPRSKLHLKPGDINICGHNHSPFSNGEKFFVDKVNKVLNINVGIDLWDYQPVSEVTLVNYIKQILSTKFCV